MTHKKFGTDEGEICWRNGCQGVIAVEPVENCSCHINPPCSACTTPREYCPECDWQAKDEDCRDYAIRIDIATGSVNWGKPRPLDPRKIDYRILPHTTSSQICEGVYPEGTTQDEVLARVRGTFGGRMEHFANGKFRYIAYTD
jgi:hypothetical protein